MHFKSNNEEILSGLDTEEIMEQIFKVVRVVNVKLFFYGLILL